MVCNECNKPELHIATHFSPPLEHCRCEKSLTQVAWEDPRVNKIKQLVQDWIAKQGHESCWYYPEIFKGICQELGIDWIQPVLPPIEEFKEGCQRYTLGLFKPFKGWVAVRDPDPEEMNDEGEDRYWFISPKDYWAKHGTCSDKAEYLEIPGFSEAMEHCYVCERDIPMEEQTKLLENMGFEIGNVDDWYVGNTNK